MRGQIDGAGLRLAMAILALCSVATVEAGQSDEPQKRLSVDLSFGWGWILGNDVRVAQRSTATESGDVFNYGLDASSQPLRTQYGSDTTLLARVAYEGEVWGVDSQLWRLEPVASTDAAFEIDRFSRTLESLQIWGISLNRDNPGAHRLSAENQLSLHSGRLEVTRAVGSGAHVAFGLHVARFENERVEALDVAHPTNIPSLRGGLERARVTTEARGWMFGPSFGVRVAARPARTVSLSLSLAQSILFDGFDQAGSASTREEILGARATVDVTAETRFSSRQAVPVTEARATVTIDLTDNLSIGVEGLFSAWQSAPLAMQFSLAESDSIWMERQGTLVFVRVAPTLRLRF